MGYIDAVITCGELGGTPVVPNSQGEFDAIGNFAAEEGVAFFWLGCEDVLIDRTFDCFDGSQLMQSSRTFHLISM